LVRKGKIEGRIDSNTYHPERTRIIHRLKETNWELKPLKLVAKFSKNIVSQNSENLPYVGLENIESDIGFYVETSERESFGSAVKFHKGQVLFPKLRPYLNKVYLAEFEGLCSTEFHILDCKTIDNRYLAHFLRSNLVVNQTKYLMSGNTLPRLQTSDIKNLLIPILPKETQAKIVALFEAAYAQKRAKEAEAKALLAGIDGYLLNALGISLPQPTEKKKFFYTRSGKVSSGRFDPYYHQSEFEEFERALRSGKYKMQKMKNVAYFQAGYAFNSNDYVEKSDCYLVTIKNILKNEINLENSTYLPKVFFDKLPIFQIKKNDLLIAMTGATIGKVGLFNSDKKALLNQRNGIIRSNNLNYLYLMSLLNTEIYQKFILRNSNGGAQPNISETDIMKIQIPLPPLAVQTEIANHIAEIRSKAKQLEQEAKAGLDQAKKEVEAMILGDV